MQPLGSGRGVQIPNRRLCQHILGVDLAAQSRPVFNPCINTRLNIASLDTSRTRSQQAGRKRALQLDLEAVEL